MRFITIWNALTFSKADSLHLRRTALIAVTSALLGAMFTIALLGVSSDAAPQQPSAIANPGPDARVLSCQDIAVLTRSDCAHFNDLSRDFDRVTEATQHDLQFMQDLQTSISNSAAYQAWAQQELGDDISSLRLQMDLDRQAKFLETLSNLLKKISETEQGLTGNLK